MAFKKEEIYDDSYHDRGMMKWQGMILSEHRAVIEQDKAKEQKEYRAPIQQSQDEISATLNAAYQSHYKIWLAVNQVDVDGRYVELSGRVLGSEAGNLYIDSHTIPLELIRCVEFAENRPFWKI